MERRSPRKRRKLEEPPHDIVLVHGVTDDGEGVRALRSRPGRLDAAEIRPARDGRPIGSAEVVRLREREGSPVLWDVETEFDGKPEPEPPRRTREGPPQVATDDYRRGWDAVFGSRRRTSDKPN